MSLPYNGRNIPLAKKLRGNLTPQEKHLWYDFLAKYPIRFQRQKPIDSFIADFYCHKAHLVIEIDGSQHYTEEGRTRDDFRTEILEGYDLLVIRFTNEQVDKNFDGVCGFIEKTVSAILTGTLAPESSRNSVAAAVRGHSESGDFLPPSGREGGEA